MCLARKGESAIEQSPNKEKSLKGNKERRNKQHLMHFVKRFSTL